MYVEGIYNADVHMYTLHSISKMLTSDRAYNQMCLGRILIFFLKKNKIFRI